VAVRLNFRTKKHARAALEARSGHMNLKRAFSCACVALWSLGAQTPQSMNAVPPVTRDVDAELASKLVSAKRIYVDSFGDTEIEKALQSMLIDSLRASKRFIVTENKEKADLILRGAALEKTTQEAHSLGSSTTVGGAAGSSHGTVNGSNGSVSGSSGGGFVARHLGIDDSQSSVETVNDARVAVRLVSTDGDVVWSTTQESKGAKYKGATADAADKVVKQLLRDIDRLSHPLSVSSR
jgi:curli biogenesis system outer membrane secretion channel CsgG